MQLLWLALQALLIYLGGAIVLGMLNEPRFDAMRVVIAASGFVILLLMTVLVQRMAPGTATGEPIISKNRRAGAALLVVLAGLSLFLAQGVVVGVWRGPRRLAALHFLAAEYAGAWSLALALGVIAALLLTQACFMLKRAAG